MPERLKRVDNLSIGQRLHREVIPAKDQRKSIPSLRVLRGEARALINQRYKLFPHGIGFEDLDSLPEELDGIRTLFLTKEVGGKKRLSLRSVVAYELFHRYRGAEIASQRKFKLRARKALGEAFELHRKNQKT